MLLPDAHAALAEVLDPLSVDEFLDDVLGQRFVKVSGGAQAYRAGLLGPTPDKAILAAFESLSGKTTCHAARPLGPPPKARPVADEAAFAERIDAYHAAGWTVRLPEVRALSEDTARFVRGLEAVLHQPVEAALFWSRGDGQAQVHYDDCDIIVIQLVGAKRWFINSDPPPLHNAWRGVAEGPPPLDPHRVVEVEPGDLLYLPCGTAHRVDALADSIHLSIGFRPLTLREAIIAALDHMSDLDRRLRVGVGNRLGQQIAANRFGDLPGQVRGALGQLMSLSQDDGFLSQALQRRSSRVIGKLDPPATTMPGAEARPILTPATRLRRHPLAVSHLIGNAERLDLAHPGGHIHIHRGVEAAVAFIANTAAFTVSEIPGAFGDDVRLALAEKFVSEGFLQVAG